MSKGKPIAPLPFLSWLRAAAESLGAIPARKQLAPPLTSYRVRSSLKPPAPWPGVMPSGIKPDLAMDAQIDAVANFGVNGYAWDGYSFMGYALLAELEQVPEFRRPSEILANEMTREWVELVSVSNADIADKLKALEAEMKKFNVREAFNKAFESDNFFGVGHIYMDFGTDGKELNTPLLFNAKIAKGSLKAFRVIEPMWTYPNRYNATDPLQADFYRPQSWFVMGKEVHASRLLTIISRPLPDMLKPAYQFGGIALTQLLQPYVQNWLRTRQSVSDITHNFSTPVLETQMDQMTTRAGAENLALRAQVYNTMRDNQGLFVIGKDKEGFKIESASLSGLDALQAQAQEQMAFPPGIPLVKLFGITPSGLNATSDGEIRVFYDTVASEQERIGSPHLKRVLEVLQMNLYGVVDPDIGFKWRPLRQLSDKELAEVRKSNADTDAVYVEIGALDVREVRKAIATEEGSRYASIDVEDLPEQNEEDLGQANLGTSVGQIGAAAPGREERSGERREAGGGLGAPRDDGGRRENDGEAAAEPGAPDRTRASLRRKPTDTQLTQAERGARE